MYAIEQLRVDDAGVITAVMWREWQLRPLQHGHLVEVPIIEVVDAILRGRRGSDPRQRRARPCRSDACLWRRFGDHHGY
jgi:hypothetical protein